MTCPSRLARPRPGQAVHLPRAQRWGDRAQQPEYERKKCRDGSKQRRAERKRRAARGDLDRCGFLDDAIDGRRLGDDKGPAERKGGVELAWGRIRSSVSRNPQRCGCGRLRSEAESSQQQHEHADRHPTFALRIARMDDARSGGRRTWIPGLIQIDGGTTLFGVLRRLRCEGMEGDGASPPRALQASTRERGSVKSSREPPSLDAPKGGHRAGTFRPCTLRRWPSTRVSTSGTST